MKPYAANSVNQDVDTPPVVWLGGCVRKRIARCNGFRYGKRLWNSLSGTLVPSRINSPFEVAADRLFLSHFTVSINHRDELERVNLKYGTLSSLINTAMSGNISDATTEKAQRWAESAGIQAAKVLRLPLVLSNPAPSVTTNREVQDFTHD